MKGNNNKWKRIVSFLMVLALAVSLIASNNVLKVQAEIGSVRYESSDANVAYVDEDGKIVWVSEGTCTIRVISQNGTIIASYDVEVKNLNPEPDTTEIVTTTEAVEVSEEDPGDEDDFEDEDEEDWEDEDWTEGEDSSEEENSQIPSTTQVVTTTQAPATTTQAPVTTTQAPATTTQAPVTTTQASAMTTKAPVTTTQVPVTTTQEPTTKAPVTTTQAPVTTTQAPVATTQAPATTTQAPATKAPVTTTQIPATTNSVATTTQSPATTTQQAVRWVVAEEKEENELELNAGLKVSQSASRINVVWSKVSEADGYNVYVQYCGKKFNTKSVYSITDGQTTNLSFKKINGKKLDLKKNVKVYVEAYKLEEEQKVMLGKSIIAHIVGRKNTKETNVKRIKLNKNTYSLKVGKTADIKAEAVLVDPNKKPLSDKHALEFRYVTSNDKVATVSKGGRIKAVSKGTCNIYIYARNGYAKKMKVKVK